MFYTQIDSIRERESTQASHLLVIFENFESYLGKPENTLSKTESSLSKSDVFVELPLIRVQRSEDQGNTLQQSEQYIQPSRWHAFYLFSGPGILRMLQGEILALYCTFVSLSGHIFASIEKFGSHV